MAPSTSDTPSSKKMENTNMKSNAKSSNKSTPLNSKDKIEHVENNSVTKTHGISSELNNMTMSGESGNSKIPNKGKMGKTASCSQYKAEKWMLPDETKDRLSQLNLAIVGHVDSGKSTLSGRLLHPLGQISQKQMHNMKRRLSYSKEFLNLQNFQVLKKEFPKGVDIVYESVGGDMFGLCFNALAIYGRMVVIGMISQTPCKARVTH
ncbi:hypothetical protein L1887_32748 [Cichorium endivia]|nr:hypothetical protein L1887_32748 [Cichorium endivia]